MLARLIAYPPDSAAVVCRPRADGVFAIGRAIDADLRLEHASVSREHAELEWRDGAWRLRDVGSKNGTFLDGGRVGDAQLSGECWLRFGDVYCEFAPLTEQQAAAEEAGHAARRAVVTARTARIGQLGRQEDSAGASTQALLDDSLQSVLELAQCERGFVLLDKGDGLQVRASRALDPSQLRSSAFAGSVGAVRRALAECRAVVVNDIGRESWLSGRESVIAAGISALVCLPLLEDGKAFGAIYADRVRPGPAITTLDLELLGAFVEGVAVWLAAQRTSALLAAHAPGPARATTDWEGILAAHGDAPATGAA